MSQTTITVQEETLERFRGLKADVPDGQTEPEPNSDFFIRMLMDEWEGDGDARHTGEDVGEIAEQLKNELSMANDPGVGVDVERVMKRIDDLESQLPRKVAEELR